MAHKKKISGSALRRRISKHPSRAKPSSCTVAVTKARYPRYTVRHKSRSGTQETHFLLVQDGSEREKKRLIQAHTPNKKEDEKKCGGHTKLPSSPAMFVGAANSCLVLYATTSTPNTRTCMHTNTCSLQKDSPVGSLWVDETDHWRCIHSCTSSTKSQEKKST